MKTFLTASLTATLISISLGLVASSAAGDRWVRLLSDSKAALYIDTASIQGRGRYRYYWQQIVFQEPQAIQVYSVGASRVPVYAYMIYTSVDCRTKIARFRRMMALDRNNRVLFEINQHNYGPLEDLDRRGVRLPAKYAANFACSRRPTR